MTPWLFVVWGAQHSHSLKSTLRRFSFFLSFNLQPIFKCRQKVRMAERSKAGEMQEMSNLGYARNARRHSRILAPSLSTVPTAYHHAFQALVQCGGECFPKPTAHCPGTARAVERIASCTLDRTSGMIKISAIRVCLALCCTVYCSEW